LKKKIREFNFFQGSPGEKWTMKDVLIHDLGVVIYGRKMWQADGKTVFQKYGREADEKAGKAADCNYSVSPYEVNKTLIRKCIAAGVKIHWNHKLTDANFDNEAKTTLTFEMVRIGIIVGFGSHDGGEDHADV
jgi:hypothetical protein